MTHSLGQSTHVSVNGNVLPETVEPQNLRTQTVFLTGWTNRLPVELAYNQEMDKGLTIFHTEFILLIHAA